MTLMPEIILDFPPIMTEDNNLIFLSLVNEKYPHVSRYIAPS